MYFWIGLDSRNINFNIRRKINVRILKYFMIYGPFRINNLAPFDRKILCAAVLLSELKKNSPSHFRCSGITLRAIEEYSSPSHFSQDPLAQNEPGDRASLNLA